MAGPRNQIRMPSPEGVSAGGTALFKIPTNGCYHGFDLNFTGVTLAQMKEIRLKVNGKVKQTISAVELNKINLERGLADATVDGILPIMLDRVGLKDRILEEATALHTGVPDKSGRVINSLQLEVEIDAAAAAPQLSLDADVSTSVAGWEGQMINLRPQSRSIAGAGDLEVTDFVYGTMEAQAINAVHYIPSAGTITKVKHERDLYPHFERTAAKNSRKLTDGGARKPQNGMFSVDTCERGFGANTIATGRWVQMAEGAQFKAVDSYIVTLSCSEACTVTAFFENIGTAF